MVEALTKNYSWTKPEVTKSTSTWGGFLNTDLDSIDALVFANQQGIVPIGGIQMFGGATAPVNWLVCDGSALDRTVYASLFAVIGTTYGGSGTNFNLPNLQGVFPLGVGPSNALASTGGGNTAAIATTNLPAHAHSITDLSHTHQIVQTPHSHGDPGHTHGVSDPGHAHSAQVSFPAGVNFAAGSGWTPVTANTSVNGTGISIQGAGTGIQAATANINGNVTLAAGTGLSTTQSIGSGTPLSLPLPPYVAINFIIRAQ